MIFRIAKISQTSRRNQGGRHFELLPNFAHKKLVKAFGKGGS